MKKFDMEKWKKVRLQKVDVSKLDEKTLLLNVYITQLLTLLVGIGLLWIQGRSVFDLLAVPDGWRPWIWGAGFGALVLAADLVLSRWIPEEVTDDGGINEMMFRRRSFLHIAALCFIVAVCEEVLFRGAVQYWLGPYWTSILFALVHVRYLQHWLMTGLVFSISYGLGWIANQTGTLWTPIAAHFMIDFIMGLIIRYRRKEDRRDELDERTNSKSEGR